MAGFPIGGRRLIRRTVGVVVATSVLAASVLAAVTVAESAGAVHGAATGRDMSRAGVAAVVPVPPPQRLAVASLAPSFFSSSVVTDGQFAYIGTSTSPAEVVKVDLATMTRVGAVTLETGENFLYSAVTDGTYGYFGTDTSPGRVVKVDLATMTRVGAVTLEPGENSLYSAVFDGIHGYFGTRTGPGIVVKIDLATMTRVGAVELRISSGLLPGENFPMSAVTDGIYGYFGTDTSPGQIVKVDLFTMTRVGSVVLEPGEDGLYSAVFDGIHGYFGTNTSPGRVVKVDLRNMSRVGAVTMETGEDQLRSAVSDGKYGYFGSNTVPAQVVKVDLMSMTRTGAATMRSGEDRFRGAVLGNGIGYFITSSLTGQLVSVGLTPLCPTVANPFDDVPPESFFDAPTACLAERGITNGVNQAGTVYAPNREVDRAQMASFLWRLSGSPDSPSGCGFFDERAIPLFARESTCWLRGESLTTNNPFNPSGVVNRAQMAAFLWRLAGEPDAPASCEFDDEAAIPSYARVATCWLLDTRITVSDPYKPEGVVNRAQMAAFLWRFGIVEGLWRGLLPLER
jgi:hypothetical protein